jgi:hypothetical protein
MMHLLSAFSFVYLSLLLALQPAKTQPATSYVKVTNKGDKDFVVKINDKALNLKSKDFKFIEVEAGNFTYQVVGFHAKPITKNIKAGEIFGLNIDTSDFVPPEKVEPKIEPLPQKEKIELPIVEKKPAPAEEQEQEEVQPAPQVQIMNTGGGRRRIFNGQLRARIGGFFRRR